MRPMVSIIVPIYNAEQYLRRCVDSILNQEYTDYELLLVNDGSTDASGDICEEYGDQDPRVIVIQKENTGVSDSRNRALDRARGKYLQFLDSDDWITPDATRLFVRAAEEYGCDMVISDFYRVVGERLSPKGDIEEEGVLDEQEKDTVAVLAFRKSDNITAQLVRKILSVERVDHIQQQVMRKQIIPRY